MMAMKTFAKNAGRLAMHGKTLNTEMSSRTILRSSSSSFAARRASMTVSFMQPWLFPTLFSGLHENPKTCVVCGLSHGLLKSSFCQQCNKPCHVTETHGTIDWIDDEEIMLKCKRCISKGSQVAACLNLFSMNFSCERSKVERTPQAVFNNNTTTTTDNNDQNHSHHSKTIK